MIVFAVTFAENVQVMKSVKIAHIIYHRDHTCFFFINAHLPGAKEVI